MDQKIDFEISMSRGDIEIVSFNVYIDGQPIDFTPDDIFFTVKLNPNDRYPLFQKSLSSETIKTGETPGTYSFKIDPEDTNSLAFNIEYACDIEVIALSEDVKKTFYGILSLDAEVTHASNERSGS